jgi:hypothetical protein
MKHYDAAMATRSSRGSVTSEVFNFDVADWSYDYGFHLDPTGKSTVAGCLGPCWETNTISIHGPLRSKTRRRIDRVHLQLRPGAPEPESWDMKRRRFGGVSSSVDTSKPARDGHLKTGQLGVGTG